MKRDGMSCCKISRRGLLRASLTATIGYLLTPGMRRLLAAEAKAPGAPAAEHLILLWMSGGPSHVDTFDPKPGRATGGPFRAISTAIGGAQFSEHLPRLAQGAGDLVVVRGMTSREGSHSRGSHLLHTGYIPNPSVHYPSLGSMVSHERGKKDFDLPSFISLGGPSEGAGFFGASHAPFVVRSRPGQPIENLKYFPKVDQQRFDDRLQLVEFMDQHFAAAGAKVEAAAHQDVLQKAKRMVQSPLASAFELGEESTAVRQAYGAVVAEGGGGFGGGYANMKRDAIGGGFTPGEFGARCLMARRLIEKGVPAVEVELSGWDTHFDNFNRTKALMGELDPAFAGLVADLKSRGLLEKTLVVCMGEFGRTPKVNPREGRDHHPKAFSAVLAGGGIRAGQVIGATDADGTQVVGTAVSVPDLFATILTRLGIDPAKVYTANDRPIALSNKGKAVAEITG